MGFRRRRSTGERATIALDGDVIQQKLVTPNDERIFYIRHALRAGSPSRRFINLTKIDPWFLAQLRELVDEEEALYRMLAKSESLAQERTR